MLYFRIGSFVFQILGPKDTKQELTDEEKLMQDVDALIDGEDRVDNQKSEANDQERDFDFDSDIFSLDSSIQDITLREMTQDLSSTWYTLLEDEYSKMENEDEKS